VWAHAMLICGFALAVLRGDSREVPAGITMNARAKAQAQRSSGQWQRDLRNARTRRIRTKPPEFCWRGLIPIASLEPAATALAIWLANGRGARFGEPQALAKSEFIVAAELDGADREARIFLAAPIGLEDLEKHFAALVTDSAEIHWDERAGAVSAKRERKLGALLLQSSEMRDPDPGAVQAAVLTGLRRRESPLCRGPRSCSNGGHASC